jgi:DNA-binding NtrC family response regulator
MSIERFLVVEDDNAVRTHLASYLREQQYEVTDVPTLAAARKTLMQDSYDLLLLDQRLPDGTGLDLLKEIKDRPYRPVVVCITGFATVQSAVECMRHGAFDYLTKPFELAELDAIIQRINDFSKAVKLSQYLNRGQDEENSELLGRTLIMEDLRQLIRRVARTDATVLIQGETGTGKELVARAIHFQSPRASGPFIKVNCAAIPDNLIESEFFGHEKGAFTGALQRREGRFELAHGGTIFLDEISEISPAIQVKLLRVLQERELERVGGIRTIKVDVRVIATTNRDLQESVHRKEFRQDLFFRLNVVPVHVPPLRERRDDVFLLAEEFMRRSINKHASNSAGLSRDCLRQLAEYDWPGNVRELQNVIERAVILCGDSCANCTHDLLHWLVKPSQRPIKEPGAAPSTPAATAPTAAARNITPLSEVEREHILAALKQCHDNRTQAASLLGISVRTLRNKLHEYRNNSSIGEPDPELATGQTGSSLPPREQAVG